MTKLSSSLPKDWEDNGLYQLNRALIQDPHGRHLIIALVDCKDSLNDTDSGAVIAQARIRRVEVVLRDADIELVRDVLQRINDERVGRETLPLGVDD